MLAPETLVRHELAGLSVRVVDAAHEGYVGIEGRVVDETANTLLVDGDSGAMQVQKAGTTFEFALAGDGEDGPSHVVVEGERFVARPARRTELTGDSKWR
ncbi:ribonuclease P [Halobacteriales archaeon QS_5_70_15]|jgi:ribonuclease P protein subunit POP4|nr:MAG: ribonuclease P [Halobacteriales archaeon QS_5_70_15]